MLESRLVGAGVNCLVSASEPGKRVSRREYAPPPSSKEVARDPARLREWVTMRRVNRHLKPQPLPQRNGIDAVSFVLPDAANSADDTLGAATVLDYLAARFYPHARPLFEDRFNRGEVRDAEGGTVAPDAPLVGQKIWYYRELGQERPVPFDMPVLYEDEWVLAIDKPHFLPTTPNGSFVAHTALVKLRVRENNPLLIPIHRLDRATAGVVLFAKTPEARAPFQTMFERRALSKTYEAIAAPIAGLGVGESMTVRSRIDNAHGQLQVAQTGVDFLPGDVPPLAPETKAEKRKRRSANRPFTGLNAESKIICLASYPAQDADAGRPSSDVSQNSTGMKKKHVLDVLSNIEGLPSQLAHYRLEPHTGKTHQLRVHLAAAGSPIIGDVIYPEVLPHTETDPELPLQLLARSLSFTHPITGEALTITSKRRLALAPR